MTLESWSQMLFQKLQRSQQNTNQKAKERHFFFFFFFWGGGGGGLQEFISHRNLSSFGLITGEIKLSRSN